MEAEFMTRFANQIWPVYWKILPVNEIELDTYMKIVRNIREKQIQFDENTQYAFIELVQLMRHTISNVKYPDIDDIDVDISDDDELYCCIRIEDDLRWHIHEHKRQ